MPHPQHVEHEFDQGSMEEAQSQSPGVAKRRKSYSREDELGVLQYWHSHDKNVCGTSRHLSILRKTVQRWIKDEEKIKESKKGARRVKFKRRANYPDVEDQLHEEYRKLRSQGLKVKGWWFKERGKHIFKELHPQEIFHFSNSWSTSFKKRYRISYQRATNVCQHPPSDKVSPIREFHLAIRKMALSNDGGPLGCYSLDRIANVDQTPLPFSYTVPQV